MRRTSKTADTLAVHTAPAVLCDAKQRYFPQFGEVAWRVETREYNCSQVVTTPAPALGRQ